MVCVADENDAQATATDDTGAASAQAACLHRDVVLDVQGVPVVSMDNVYAIAYDTTGVPPGEARVVVQMRLVGSATGCPMPYEACVNAVHQSALQRQLWRQHNAAAQRGTPGSAALPLGCHGERPVFARAAARIVNVVHVLVGAPRPAAHASRYLRRLRFHVDLSRSTVQMLLHAIRALRGRRGNQEGDSAAVVEYRQVHRGGR